MKLAWETEKVQNCHSSLSLAPEGCVWSSINCVILGRGFNPLRAGVLFYSGGIAQLMEQTIMKSEK